MQRAPESRRRRNQHRVAFVVVAAVVSLFSLMVQPGDEASATSNDEAAFLDALNVVRADNDLPPFTMNAELSDLSRVHAQVMADAGEIFHASPISGGYTGAWQKFGENVGVGANVAVLVDAFVASPGHFANIIDPAFSEVGIGVVWIDNALYTTHRFLQPSAPTPTTTAPTTTAQATLPPETTTAPSTTVVSTTAPTTTTVPEEAPLPVANGPTSLAEATPTITAARVLELLEMLDAVGT